MQSGSVECLKIVLEYESNKINDQACDGKTALHWAVQAGNLPMVKFLLDAGINRNISDNNGLDAHALALQLGHKDIAALIQAYPR